MKKVRKAVIPAAGLGTRFLPATKGLPKEMLPIIDKPTLLYQVEEAVNAGCEEVILIISKAKEDIKKFFVREESYEEYLRSKGQNEFADEIKRIATLCKITYVYQNEMKGLGHAILCTKDAIGDEPFLVILGDDLVINKNGPTASEQLIEAYNKTGKSILGVQKVSLEATKKYGIVDPISEDGRLIKMKGMVEKPASNPPSLYAALGRYVITSDIFDLLETTKPGKGGEIQLTDALKRLDSIYAYDFIGTRYDIGDKFGYVTAIIDLALDRDDLREKTLSFIKNKIN
ncbi:MAG: UTP--glucose-1-phosphate uridylyltransferase [Bacilli bacterium]|nr:UTP--glucose-1-phosphate uridylyltransferase [Bacilli bacterium]